MVTGVFSLEDCKTTGKHLQSTATGNTGVPCALTCTRWTNLHTLLSLYGHRYVPVEIGQYESEGQGHSQWEERLVSLREFFVDYLLHTQGKDETGTK